MELKIGKIYLLKSYLFNLLIIEYMEMTININRSQLATAYYNIS